MADDLTYGQSTEILAAVAALEKLEQSGDIRPAEQKALDQWRKKTASAKQVDIDTRASYRGLQKGATLKLADEGAGVISALTGGDYSAARDAVREKDQAAMLLAPEEFSRGEMAGGVMTSVLPGLGVMNATKGMSALGRAGWGALSGGLLGGVSGFAGGEGLADRLSESVVPGIIGGVLGGLAPGVGNVAGAMYRGAKNFGRRVDNLSPLATRSMALAMDKSAASGTDITAYLNRLGPEGMMADIPGNPRKVAQGLASMPGEGGELLGNAIERRALDAGSRIKRDADAVIGAPDVAFQEKARLAQERVSVLGPEYDAALAAKGPLDISGLGEFVSDMRGDSVGAVSASLAKLESALGKKVDDAGEVTYEPISALKLHNLRSELSDDITEATRAGRGKFVTQMAPALERIDEQLDTLPGYADARTGYANNKAMERALEDGRAVFRGGEASALSPPELRKQLQGKSPAELDAYRKGAREYIDALMGTSRNDAAAAWGSFAKEWNEEKLRIVLGKTDADKIINRLQAEGIFSATRGDVLKGSQTEMRRSAASELADLRTLEGGRPGPIKRATTAVGGVANNAIDAMLYGPRRSAANLDLGRALSATGPERDRLVQGLLAEAMYRKQPARGEGLVSGLLDAALRASAPAATVMLPYNNQ